MDEFEDLTLEAEESEGDSPSGVEEYSFAHAQVFVNAYRMLGSVEDSCKQTGISADTYDRWMKEHEDFREMVLEAQNVFQNLLVRDHRVILMDAISAIRRSLRGEEERITQTIQKKLAPHPEGTKDPDGKTIMVEVEIVQTIRKDKVPPDFKVLQQFIPVLKDMMEAGGGLAGGGGGFVGGGYGGGGMNDDRDPQNDQVMLSIVSTLEAEVENQAALVARGVSSVDDDGEDEEMEVTSE